jgi:uncharacterized membrane protein YhfC
MISSAALISMVITSVFISLLPMIVFAFFRKKEKIGFKSVLIGAVGFFVTVQILEQSLHKVVIGNNLIPNPILFSIYGALAAGVFEETARFIAFKTILKNNHQWKDGIAYGIGHGGIEAIIIGATFIVMGIMIRTGTFDTILGQQVSADQAAQMKKLIIQNAANSNLLLDIIERIFAFGIQIALTMVVLYAVKYRKNIYLFIAILLHTLIDTPAALFQSDLVTDIFVIEGMLFLIFIVAIVFLSKTKKIFRKEVM